tara:strand:+ start:461 stop:973 length:513 start_codon:yes stop_codon:yes gene_type:complete
MTIKIRENYDLIIAKHPFADGLKDKLIEESGTYPLNGSYTNIVGEKYPCHNVEYSPSNIIRDWIISLIRNKIDTLVENVDYQVDKWFAKYNKGDYAKTHDHIPYSIFSFVYFVKSPRGSSPLVFTTSGKRIKAEEGKVVIFPSFVKHHVPKNKCEGRLVLAGNVKSLRVA